MIQKTAFALV